MMSRHWSYFAILAALVVCGSASGILAVFGTHLSRAISFLGLVVAVGTGVLPLFPALYSALRRALVRREHYRRSQSTGRRGFLTTLGGWCVGSDPNVRCAVQVALEEEWNGICAEFRGATLAWHKAVFLLLLPLRAGRQAAAERNPACRTRGSAQPNADPGVEQEDIV